MPSSKHRVPTKSTPFSNTAAAVSGSRDGSSTATRSQMQRIAMTTSIRKAKRNQTVSRKRHMPVSQATSSTASAIAFTNTSVTVQLVDNPYTKDSNHVKETIELVHMIFTKIHGKQGEEGAPSSQKQQSRLSAMLDRLCILITPADNTINNCTSCVAANSILSQFVVPPAEQQQRLSSSSQQSSRQDNLAFLFAQALSNILHNSDNLYDTATRIKAVIVLNQLAATEPLPPNSFSEEESNNQFSPYANNQPHHIKLSPSQIANIPTSWCFVLVQSSALSALVTRLSSSSSLSTNEEVELIGKVIGVIGNLAGDSEMARNELVNLDILVLLIGCLLNGLDMIRQLMKFQQQQQSSSITSQEQQSLIDLLRNTVWSITNLYRERSYKVSDLLNMSINIQDDDEQGGDMSCDFLSDDQMAGLGIARSKAKSQRLTSDQVVMLLTLPELMPPNANNPTKVTPWNDVAIEMIWLLSFITKQDSMAIDYFFKNGQFISALITTLVVDTYMVGQQLSNTADARGNNIDTIPGSLISCCRTLKNIALASDGQYVNSILTSEVMGQHTTLTASNDNAQPRPVEKALAQLISLGTLGAGNEINVIAIAAASTAGALLYDAGLDIPHPPTLACRTILPILCQGLICPTSTFDFQKEVTWSIWNAVHFPPGLFGSRDNAFEERVFVVQNELLMQLLHTPVINETVKSLMVLLYSMDNDAMEPALCLINLLLRRYGSSQSGGLTITFEEIGLVDALWHICNNDSDESYVAELAAEILDNYYEKNDEEESDDNEMLQPAVSSSGQFQFGVQEESIGEYLSPGVGRGRGRGKSVPAWMQNQT